MKPSKPVKIVHHAGKATMLQQYTNLFLCMENIVQFTRSHVTENSDRPSDTCPQPTPRAQRKMGLFSLCGFWRPLRKYKRQSTARVFETGCIPILCIPSPSVHGVVAKTAAYQSDTLLLGSIVSQVGQQQYVSMGILYLQNQRRIVC